MHFCTTQKIISVEESQEKKNMKTIMTKLLFVGRFSLWEDAGITVLKDLVEGDRCHLTN